MLKPFKPRERTTAAYWRKREAMYIDRFHKTKSPSIQSALLTEAQKCRKYINLLAEPKKPFTVIKGGK